MADESNVDLDRPLTARSAVLSLLLGRRPPKAPVALLVRWCELFGVTGNAARVALSRMVERGELVTDDGVYALAGRVQARQHEQEEALTPAPTDWDGTWHVVVLTGGARPAPERLAQRQLLRRSRLAELREGVWVRPATAPLADAASLGAAMRWRGTPEDREPLRLAEELFALRAWADRAGDLARRVSTASASLRVGPDLRDEALAPAFVAGAAAMQHLRRDPRLPPALVGDGWPGDELREAYEEYQRRFSDAVAQWWRRHRGSS